MAIRADGREVNIGSLSSDSTEIESMRTRTSAAFDNGDGTAEVIVLSSPVHYQKDGNWVEIDNRWTVSDDLNWDYQMLECDYQAYINSRFDSQTLLRLQKADSYIEYKPLSLSWVNDSEEEEIISVPLGEHGCVQETDLDQINTTGHVSWLNCYGPGIHFTYTPCTSLFIKNLIIDSFDKLPSPSVENPKLKLSFQFNTNLTMQEDLTFTDSEGNTIFAWAAPKAWDSADNQINLEYEITDGVVSVMVPMEWLETASYPVMIDPTTVYDDPNDGCVQMKAANAYSWWPATQFNTNAIYLYVGRKVHATAGII